MHAYEGIFRINKTTTVTFAVKGGVLYERLTGEFFHALIPSAENTFALPASDAEWKFTEENNHFSTVTQHQGLYNVMATRSDEPLSAQAVLEPDTLQAFVGHYKTDPQQKEKLEFDVQSIAGQLGVRLNDQPRFPVMPIANKVDRFAYDVVEAELQFERNTDGKVTTLILYQNGKIHRTTKLTTEDEIAQLMAQFKNLPIYLRGSMNQWGLKNKMRAIGGNLFATTITPDKGHQEFKVGSEDFRAIDFGAISGEASTALNSVKKMGASGENFFIDVPRRAAYTFSFDTTDPYAPTLSVKDVKLRR